QEPGMDNLLKGLLEAVDMAGGWMEGTGRVPNFRALIRNGIATDDLLNLSEGEEDVDGDGGEDGDDVGDVVMDEMEASRRPQGDHHTTSAAPSEKNSDVDGDLSDESEGDDAEEYEEIEDVMM
ncbi:hypothetical protein PMAYCL1PPCAC_20697, partial [Pristionchus mayeri]